MRRSIIGLMVILGHSVVVGPAPAAAVSVTSLSYSPGDLTGGLNTDAFKDTSAAKFQDFPRDVGGDPNKYARGLSNNSFAASTLLPIARNGGVTFQFDQPVNALPGAKELGIFTASFLLNSGAFFTDDMEGAILVSKDNVEWRTLTGEVVADPLTYSATVNNLNAPTMSYVWGTGQIAWDYCTGPGQPQSVLDTFPLADYETPMLDDSLFNDPASTNEQRAALNVSTLGADYAAIFGNSAGGNWFDISATGLDQIQYLRINVAGDAPATLRLDSVFANAAAVPEPSAMMLALCCAAGWWSLARKRPAR